MHHVYPLLCGIYTLLCKFEIFLKTLLVFNNTQIDGLSKCVKIKNGVPQGAVLGKTFSSFI